RSRGGGIPGGATGIRRAELRRAAGRAAHRARGGAPAAPLAPPARHRPPLRRPAFACPIMNVLQRPLSVKILYKARLENWGRRHHIRVEWRRLADNDNYTYNDNA